MTDTLPKLAHSYSSLKMYENCPKRYYHQRITKEVTDQGGEATIYGERLHKMIEERLRDETPLPDEAKDYAPMVEAVLRGLKPDDAMLIEQEMTLNRKLKPTGWWDEDAWMRSKLDVLILRGDTAVVLDWKTGKRRPDFNQLELFALQVFTHHKQIKEVSSCFVWLKDQAMDRHMYNRNNIGDLWSNLLNKVSRIERSLHSDDWPAKPSGLCRFCPAQHLCEYGRL
jgi:hypothetical protein